MFFDATNTTILLPHLFSLPCCDATVSQKYLSWRRFTMVRVTARNDARFPPVQKESDTSKNNGNIKITVART